MIKPHVIIPFPKQRRVERAVVRPMPKPINPPAPQLRVATINGRARISGINPIFPVYGTPTTASVRDNFQYAKDEIEALQAEKLDLAGGTMTGEIIFAPNQRIDGGTF